jgi:hypothetical protein
MSHQQFREANRLSWNEAIQARNRHKGDDAAFFRDGANTLDPEERALLGDMTGSSVVHLQCNCGEDTFSLAQLGAIATGVDISDTAIETARSLSLNKRKLHCPSPSGFSPHVKAIRWASFSPSKMRFSGRSGWGRRLSASWSPCVTKR